MSDLYRCRKCGAAAELERVRDPNNPGLLGIVPLCPNGHERADMRRARRSAAYGETPEPDEFESYHDYMASIDPWYEDAFRDPDEGDR